MNIFIENRRIDAELAQVPTMNFGQMQRWEDFVPLRYSLKLKTEKFLEKISDFFSEFRAAEMEEDDTCDFPELIAFKNAGWPDLNTLAKDHQTVLKDLIMFNEYEILHIMLKQPKTTHDFYYSVNSVDEVIFENDVIRLSGTCFQSDYIEHTFNHELPRKYALLKNEEQNLN